MKKTASTKSMPDFGEKNHSAILPRPYEQQPVVFIHEYWTTDETASYLRIEPQTLRKAISKCGHYIGLTPRRLGRRLYFKGSDVRAMLEAA